MHHSIKTNGEVEDEQTKTRNALLLQLRVELHEEIILRYSGGGDQLDCTEIENGPSREDLVDFLVGYVEQARYGFWNDTGGYGEVHWDITADKITLSHTNYVMSEEHYPDEEF